MRVSGVQFGMLPSQLSDLLRQLGYSTMVTVARGNTQPMFTDRQILRGSVGQVSKLSGIGHNGTLSEAVISDACGALRRACPESSAPS